MKKLTLLILFAVSSVATFIVNADTKSYQPVMQQANTTPVWPSTMPVYQWPTQQMMSQPRTNQVAPMYANPQAARMMPQYPAPYQGMQYPTNTGYPPVLRYPANQTFQQARPVYNFNEPYGVPMAANPYAPRMAPQAMRPPQVMPQQNQAMARAPSNRMAFPAKKKPEPKKKKPWGDTRHIWPDFYTDSTGDMWDNMMNAPYDMGRMPGGWRAPSLSTPDPVTVGDAVSNQFPPVIDEIPNFMPLMN